MKDGVDSAPDAGPDAALLADVAGRAEALEAAAATHEAAARVDPELSAALGRAGYYRMLVPRTRGGLQVRAKTFVAVLEALASADAATAWCVMTGATTGLLAAYLPEDGAAQIMADPDVALAGVFAPAGKAVPVVGGYRLSGRWTFCSGCENAAWRVGGALVMTPDGPRRGADGAPEVRSMFVPAGASSIERTWEVAGLCGTGSHDLIVQDVFVPQAHTSCLSTDTPVAGALYRVPPFGLLALGVAAVALGIGRAALDACRLQASQARPGGKPRLGDSAVQVGLVHAEARVRAAAAWVAQTLDALPGSAEDDVAAAGRSAARDTIGLRQRAQLRIAASHAVRCATGAVDTAHQLGGGAAVYRSNPLQRHHRDIHTLRQHIMVAPGASKLAARAWLGLPGEFAML